MSNEEISRIVQAVLYLIAVILVIALLVVMGKLEMDAKKREKEYISKLNEHDKAVIMNYKVQSNWIKRKDDKK